MLRKPKQVYYEPFCGSCWVTRYIVAEQRYCSDLNAPLVALWQALQAGWSPPKRVTEDEYKAAQRGEYEPYLTAFILIGCSFAGRWGEGYARDPKSPRNYAHAARSGLLTGMRTLRDVCFTHADFMTLPPPREQCLIYCDPPYANTKGYGLIGKFDSAAFWRRIIDLELLGHTVVISEYIAPPGFSCVMEIPTKTELRTTANGRENRIERLFRYGDHEPLQLKLF